MKGKKLTALLSAAAMLAAMLVPVTGAGAAETTLTVGSGKQYSTISAAVARAKEINPQSEAEMVTIDVDPGNYEEQVRIDGLSYVTLRQTPDTSGRVNLSWYFCTGYCTSNTDLNGLYSPTIDWSRDETWTGYNEGDKQFTKYEIGQSLEGVSTISYYDTNGVAHEDVSVSSSLKNLGGLGWSYDKMAPLIVTSSSSNITIKDFNVVNSVPVMKTAAEEAGHLTPEAGSTLLDHGALSICGEDTVMVKPTADIFNTDGSVSKDKYTDYIAGKEMPVFNAGESAWLLRSSLFNERGHAIATLGDKIIFENVRARGNQDSIWASGGRAYFKNCTLIGGTDYIYGSAAAVFDGCSLGFAGFTDKSYGNPLATPNTAESRRYGYLFWNCTVYNEDTCSGGTSNFGGPWGAAGQSTMYNTTIDDDGKISGNKGVSIDAKGWTRFGAEEGKSRVYEYGTKNNSGSEVDLSQRVVNKSVEEGGYGMGTVLDKWQILEFNPRNYFSRVNDSSWTDDWDPMGFGTTYLAAVDSLMGNAIVNVPEGEDTVVTLPTSTNENIEYHWVSNSSNAVVSADEQTINVVRPAAGEESISSSVILYARDKTTGYGDMKEIPVTIAATTNTADVFTIPVTVTQSTEGENTYTITITKDGALIKQQTVAVTAGQKTAEANIENIPASTDGIDYDVKVVSASDYFTVTVPEDGKTAVKGVTGQSVNLSVTSLKLIDDTVDLGISAAASEGNKTYDLIALAKSAGASGSISSSDQITVEMDVSVAAELKASSFIDISSGTPSDVNSAVAERFTIFKLYDNWKQIDTVDNAQGFSGASNGEHQCLNITGKFDYSTVNHIKATIDYKARSVTIDGSGSGNGKSATPYTFGSFPETADKGTLNMGLFIGNTTDSITISNVKVTYKKSASEEEPTAQPSAGVYELWKADANTAVTAGAVYTDSANLYVYAPFAGTLNGNLTAEMDNIAFTHDINIRVDSITVSSATYTEQSGKTPLEIAARNDGTLKIYYRRQNDGGAKDTEGNPIANFTAGNGKDIKLVKKVNGAYEAVSGIWTVGTVTDNGAYATGSQTFELEKGCEYLLYASGTTGRLFGYSFTPAPTETAAPTPEPSPTPIPTEAPDGEGITVITGTKENFGGIGNKIGNTDEFEFTDDAPAMPKSVLKSSSNAAKINQDYVESYVNYIGGAGDSSHVNPHPVIKVTPKKAGKYNLYYVGYNNENGIKAAIGDKTYSTETGVSFAKKTEHPEYVLKVYTVAIELPEGESTITLDTLKDGAAWLPDAYVIAVVGTAEKPDYEGVEIAPPTAAGGASKRYSEKPGELADLYRTEIDYSRVSAPKLGWFVKNKDNKRAAVALDTAISGDGNVKFGLIITGTAEELDTISSVSLEPIE